MRKLLVKSREMRVNLVPRAFAATRTKTTTTINSAKKKIHSAVVDMAKAGHETLGGSLDGYSLIFKRTMNDGRIAAVKRVITGTTDINEVNKLIELSKHKQHENVIRYFLIEQQDPYCFIYLEFCSGNLCDFVEDPRFDSGGLDQRRL